MPLESNTRVELLRADYCKVTGQPFKHFFCPILFMDEPSELCEGHIVPEAFGNRTIPQRKDVDNLYGAATEADVVGFIEDRGSDLMSDWQKPAVHRRLHPRFVANGKTIEHYFPKRSIRVAGHTLAEMVGKDGKSMGKVMFKIPEREIENLTVQNLQLVVERDVRASFVGSVLKAAHLTMFDMLGYEYVFSPTGQYLAEILRRFYFEAKERSEDGSKRILAEEYFLPYSRMVFPMLGDGARGFAGTMNDNQGIMCFGMSEGPFAIGIVIEMREQTLCCLLPPDNAAAIGTYQSFLRDPPPSMAIRNFWLRRSEADGQTVWEVQKDAYRIEIPPSMDP